MSTEADPASFYDELADDYHLIFADWDAAIRRQALIVRRLLDEHGHGVQRVLDATCGIGTQAIGLAQQGFEVTATDISRASVARCAREASARGLPVRTGVADLRSLDRVLTDRFDAVLSFDNALPHLLSDEDLAAASAALRRVLLPGGVLCGSIRDYDAILEARPSGDPPRAFTTDEGERVVFQVWNWNDDDRYTVRHFLLERRADRWSVRERRTSYRALRRGHLTTMLRDAGFASVQWLLPGESDFYQPVVVAHAPV